MRAALCTVNISMVTVVWYVQIHNQGSGYDVHVIDPKADLGYTECEDIYEHGS